MIKTKKCITLAGQELCYELQRGGVKNINLRVRADGTVRVSAPQRVPLEEIERFLRCKERFILSAITRATEKSAASGFDGSVITLLGNDIPVSAASGSRAVVLTDDGITVYLPQPEDQDSVRNTLERWLRTQCRRELEDMCRRVYPLFEKRGIAFPQIKLRHMVSQWGNCRPASGVLTFSTRLISCPRECIEYIVLHEFCHFVFADHSRDFYALMTELMHDWKQRREKLNMPKHYIK